MSRTYRHGERIRILLPEDRDDDKIYIGIVICDFGDVLICEILNHRGRRGNTTFSVQKTDII